MEESVGWMVRDVWSDAGHPGSAQTQAFAVYCILLLRPRLFAQAKCQ